MIKYDLKCSKGHSFESWFESFESFEKLKTSKLLSCSICGDGDVQKKLMAPLVQPARRKVKKTVNNSPARDAHSNPLTTQNEFEKAITHIRKYLEKSCENVGSDFVKEVRAINDGDAPERPIYGDAKIEEAKALIDDGIDVVPLPWSNKRAN